MTALQAQYRSSTVLSTLGDEGRCCASGASRFRKRALYDVSFSPAVDSTNAGRGGASTAADLAAPGLGPAVQAAATMATARIGTQAHAF